MYHPYLFSRRAELLALRDLSGALPLADTVSPILESVNSDPADLLRCMQVLGEAHVRTSVIMNPIDGDFKIATNRQPWRHALGVRFAEFPTLLPAFICRPTNTPQDVDHFLDAYQGRDVSLLYWSPNLPNTYIQTLANLQQVAFHINLHDQMAVTQRVLLPHAKAVDVVDHFDRLARNADYGGAEFFSDDHQTFALDSAGFGDYTVIGARYIPGGGQAYAVVIHAVYLHASGAFWVEHFLSDDTDVEVGTVEGKYLQAAAKLSEAVILRPGEFGADAAIVGYQNDVANHYFPGLAMNKRRQIYHHISLVHSHLVVGESNT